MSIMGIRDPVLLRLQDRPDLTFTSLCRAWAFAGVTEGGTCNGTCYP